MPAETRGRSKFAQSIIAILESSGMSRKEWARALTVSESAVSQWVNDIAIPKPGVLNLLLERAAQIPTARDAVNEFLTETARIPAERATRRFRSERIRLERRRIACLGDYMLEPKLQQFLDLYENASTEDKSDLLQNALQGPQPSRNIQVSRRDGTFAEAATMLRQDGVWKHVLRAMKEGGDRDAAWGIRDDIIAVSGKQAREHQH